MATVTTVDAPYVGRVAAMVAGRPLAGAAARQKQNKSHLWPESGIEPLASCTQSKHHTTRPHGRCRSRELLPHICHCNRCSLGLVLSARLLRCWAAHEFALQCAQRLAHTVTRLPPSRHIYQPAAAKSRRTPQRSAAYGERSNKLIAFCRPLATPRFWCWCSCACTLQHVTTRDSSAGGGRILQSIANTDIGRHNGRLGHRIVAGKATCTSSRIRTDNKLCGCALHTVTTCMWFFSKGMESYLDGNDALRCEDEDTLAAHPRSHFMVTHGQYWAQISRSLDICLPSPARPNTSLQQVRCHCLR